MPDMDAWWWSASGGRVTVACTARAFDRTLPLIIVIIPVYSGTAPLRRLITVSRYGQCGRSDIHGLLFGSSANVVWHLPD
jgi:hypothetical protein